MYKDYGVMASKKEAPQSYSVYSSTKISKEALDYAAHDTIGLSQVHDQGVPLGAYEVRVEAG